MAGRARGSARSLLAALLAPALAALLVSPARGRGGRGHGDWDAAAQLPPLPPREDAARVARFVAHVCDWGALASLSTDPAVRGWAFADVLSLSDGPPGAGSGVPYFYLSPLQQSVGNLQQQGGNTQRRERLLQLLGLLCTLPSLERSRTDVMRSRAQPVPSFGGRAVLTSPWWIPAVPRVVSQLYSPTGSSHRVQEWPADELEAWIG